MEPVQTSDSRPLVPRRISTFIAGLDLVAIILAYIASIWLADFVLAISESYFEGIAQIYTLSRVNIYAVIGLFVIGYLFKKGHYTQRVPWWNQMQSLVYITAIAIIIDGFCSFAFYLNYSLIVIIANWVLCFGLLVLFRWIAYKVRRNSPLWRLPTAIIGDASTATDVLYAFCADPSTGYEVQTVFLRDKEPQNFNLEDLPAKYRNLTVNTGYNDHEVYISEHPDHFYLVALESFRGQERDRLIDLLNQHKSRFAIIPTIARMSLYEMEPRYFFGNDVMLLHSKNGIFSPFGEFSKRALDIIASSTALMLLAPVFLVIAACLKLEKQGGSLFYGGKRLGRNGKTFKCWKFRSMAPNSDHLLHDLLERDPEARAYWDVYLKLPNDPRVTTRTARIIRKASLDEIPQLWNVLIGDMSLVGPRPILENEIELYGSNINEYIRVRPGITGLWQVSGRSSVSFQRRIYWDSWYVRNWSLWSDIVIILKTIPVVISRSDSS